MKLRCYISSTFTDMYLEREGLHLEVLGYINKVCEDFGVNFEWVDLAWGLTQEDFEQRKGVDIILDEVERCDLFLSVLGENYGWIPLCEESSKRKELFTNEISINEAEIITATNGFQSMDNAVFCFRDPESSKRFRQLSGEEEQKKLALLKDRIRESSAELLDGYKTKPEFFEFITKILIKQIKNVIIGSGKPVRKKRALLPYEGDKPYVFISYAHRDSELVMPYLEELQRRGYRFWFDKGIDPGAEFWPEVIGEHLTNASFVLLFMSKNAAASKNVRREIVFSQNENIPMVTVLLEETELSAGLKLTLGAGQQLTYSYRYDDREELYEVIFASKLFEPTIASG